MLGSLRVRLPLVFLAGIVLAGVITTAISIRLFQQFTENQTLSKLNREAHGIAELYSKAVNAGYGNKNRDQKAPTFAGKTLEKATGDRIYLLGPRLGLFPGQITGLRPLPQEPIDWHIGKSVTFEFTPPGQHRRYLAVANPIASSGTTIGAIVVATPKTDIRQQVVSLIGRLAIAGALGLLVAAAARLVSVATHRAADPAALRCRRRGCERQLRRQGAAERAGRARPPERARRRDGRPARSGRADGAQLPDVRLARAADTAHGDPRSCRGAARRRDRRPGAETQLTRDGRGRDAAAGAAGRRHPRPREARHESVHGDHRRGRHGAR